MTVLGNDISAHQALAAWSTAGLGFVIARASIGTSADIRYAAHISKARNAGLLVGAYHFGRADSTAADQAAKFLAAAGTVDSYALDVEAYKVRDAQGRNPGDPGYVTTRAVMSQANAKAFVAAVHKAGHLIGLYHSESSFFDAGQDWDWVANWSNTPHHPFLLWQYRGSPLDLDRYEGSLAQLRAAWALPPAPPSDIGDTMRGFSVILPGGPSGTITVKNDGEAFMHLSDGKLFGIPKGSVKHPAHPILLDEPINAGPGDRRTGYLFGDPPSFLMAASVTFTPDATDCTAQLKQATDLEYNRVVGGSKITFPPRV